MDAIVIFRVGDTEIKTVGGVPVGIPEGKGRDNMTINNAISKVMKDTGIDLYKVDENIKDKAEVSY